MKVNVEFIPKSVVKIGKQNFGRVFSKSHFCKKIKSEYTYATLYLTYCMNTLQSTPESRLNRLIIPQENPELEALWTSVFADEYKPEVQIDYVKIKNALSSLNIQDLCDYMLSLDSTKKNSISILESLRSDQKKIVVELFLKYPLEKVAEKYGMAMVFWLWYYSSPYNEKQKEWFQKFWSEAEWKDSYDLLEKARNAQPYYKRYIWVTLKQYIMFRNLYIKPLNDEYTKQTLWADFSFAPLTTKNQYEKGITKDWDWKNFDKQGQEISDDVFRNIALSEKNQLWISYKQVANYANPDIHKDFSWTQYRLYLDWPVWIWLMYKGKPVAVISFSLKNMDTIYIYQMQKISAYQFDRFGRNMWSSTNPLLHNINWQEILYNTLLTFATNLSLGIKKIEIKSAINNEWIETKRSKLDYSSTHNKRIEIETDKLHLSKEIAKKIYDNFARKQWFEQDKKSKDWKKNI